jgi:hypothetical protein
MNGLRNTLLAASTALMMMVGTSTAWAGACTGATSCVDSGAFATDVTQVTGSWDSHHRTYYVRVNFRVRNASSGPLMLGFRWRSAASLVDNFRNSYSIDWKYRDRIVGIGIIGGNEADASFIVPPGGSRAASLVFSRSPGRGSVGNTFNADFSLEQLEPIPGNNSVRTVATQALSFQALTLGQLIGGSAPTEPDQKVQDVVNGLGALVNALKKK